MWKIVLEKVWSVPLREQEPWQIGAARFCTEKQTGFTQRELFDYLDGLNVPKSAQRSFFTDSISSPMGSKYGRQDDGGVWTAPVELVSMVIDYDELKEARRNARHAWYFSLAAVVITSVGVILQYLSWAYR